MDQALERSGSVAAELQSDEWKGIGDALHELVANTARKATFSEVVVPVLSIVADLQRKRKAEKRHVGREKELREQEHERAALWEICFRSAAPSVVPSLFQQGLAHDTKAVLNKECLLTVLLVCGKSDQLTLLLLEKVKSFSEQLELIARQVLKCLKETFETDPSIVALAMELVAQILHIESKVATSVVVEIQKLSLEGKLAPALEGWMASFHEGVELVLFFSFFEIVLAQVHFADLIEHVIPKFVGILFEKAVSHSRQKEILLKAVQMCLSFPEPLDFLCLFKKAPDANLKVRCIKGLTGVKAVDCILEKQHRVELLRLHADWMEEAIFKNSIYGVKNPYALQSLSSLLIAAGASDNLLHFVSESLGAAESSNVILTEIMLHAISQENSNLLCRISDELKLSLKSRDDNFIEFHKKMLAQISLVLLSKQDEMVESAVEASLKELVGKTFTFRADREILDRIVLCFDKLYCTVLSSMINEGNSKYNAGDLFSASSSAADDPVNHLCLTQDILVKALKGNNDANQGSYAMVHCLCDHAKAMHRHQTRATQSYHKHGIACLPRFCWQLLVSTSLTQCARADLWFPSVSRALKMPIDCHGFNEVVDMSYFESDIDLKSFSSMHEFNSVMTLTIQDVSHVLRMASQSAYSLLLSSSNEIPSSSGETFSKMMLSLTDVPSLIASYPIPLSPQCSTGESLQSSIRSALAVASESSLLTSMGAALSEGRFAMMVKTHAETDGGKYLLLTGSYMLDIMLSISWSIYSLHGTNGLEKAAAQLMNKAAITKADSAKCIGDLLASLKCAVNDILASSVDAYRVIVAAGLLEMYTLFAKVSHSSEKACLQDIFSMSMDVASKAHGQQIENNLRCDVKICMIAARSWQFIASSQVRCYEMEKVGPSWGSVQVKAKQKCKIRRVLNEISSHFYINALKQGGACRVTSLETLAIKGAVQAFVEKSRQCDSSNWSPELSYDGVVQYVHRRMMQLIEVCDVDHLSWHCTKLKQIIKLRCSVGSFSCSRGIDFPLHAHSFAFGKVENSVELHISRCKKVLPLNLVIESLLCTVNLLLGSSSKYASESWRVLTLTAEIAVEIARLIQLLCEDMNYMFATPASSVSVSDAVVCLKKCHMLIDKRLQRVENEPQAVSTFGEPSLAIKTALHELTNQLKFIMNKIKPLSRRKADQISSDPKENILATNNSEEEEETDDDLEPSLSSDEEEGSGQLQRRESEMDDDEESGSEDDFVVMAL